MNNTLHEPQLIADAKNGIGYMAVLVFLTVMTGIIFTGLLAPFFYPAFMRNARKVAQKDIDDGKFPPEDFPKRLIAYRTVGIVLLVVWFAFSVGFLYLALHNEKF